MPEEVARWRTYNRGKDHPREDDGAVGCSPEVPLLALAFRKMICWQVSPRVRNVNDSSLTAPIAAIG